MDMLPSGESSIILTDFVIHFPQRQHDTHDRFFVDIFATRGSEGCVDQTFQPTLKIRRLGPLEHLLKDGKSFWTTDQSVVVPLSTQHVDIAVSTENPKYSPTKLGNIEKDIDALLDVSFKEGILGVSGWNSSDGVLAFMCVVMPRNELGMATENAHRKLAIVDKREQQVHAWLESEADKRSRFQKLGAFFYQCFERTQHIPNIERAIAYQGEILRLTPESHPDKPSWLNNLGNSLLSRFKQLGDLNDINKSVLMKEDAVQLTPDGHPDKPSWLNTLGNSLFRRFERLGGLNDVNKSVLMLEDAVQLTPDGHPDKPSRLNNLGNSFFHRFEQL
ncbi:hypothetical protein GALMADRAFT_142237, partial [Galerina marginata CBS 339.88]